mgnify:CR=1 FL=1
MRWSTRARTARARSRRAASRRTGRSCAPTTAGRSRARRGSASASPTSLRGSRSRSRRAAGRCRSRFPGPRVCLRRLVSLGRVQLVREGGTRRVQFVREGGTRLVQLVREGGGGRALSAVSQRARSLVQTTEKQGVVWLYADPYPPDCWWYNTCTNLPDFRAVPTCPALPLDEPRAACVDTFRDVVLSRPPPPPPPRRWAPRLLLLFQTLRPSLWA